MNTTWATACPNALPILIFFSTGLAGLAAAAEMDPELVMLPPLVVEGTIPEPAWRYGRSVRYEVLSCCPERLTRDLVASITRATDVLEAILPSRFLPPPAPRDALILVDETLWSVRAQQTVVALLRASRSLAGLVEPPTPEAGAPPAMTSVDPLDRGGPLVWSPPPRQRPSEFFRNLRLRDADAMTTFVLVSREHLDLDGWRVSPGSLRESLERRTPHLPPWFVTGFLALYGQLRFEDGRWILPPQLDWPGADRSSARNGPTSPVGVMSLEKFFARPGTGDAPGANEDAALRLAQAELLVRWGVDPENPSQQDGFWRFIDRACIAPVTETMFAECFGYGFAEGTTRLETHRTASADRTVRWRYEKPVARAELAFTLREATRAEIARIKGGWERLEVAHVRGRFPELVAPYFRQALSTLTPRDEPTGHEDDVANAAVAAELGLLHDDMGQVSSARELLEQAAATGDDMRPIARVRLALLRYHEIRAMTWTPHQPLTAAELEPVLECLRAADEQPPRIAETYRLLARVWSEMATTPAPADLALVYHGAMQFAQDADTVLEVVALLAKAGDFYRARTLANLSLSQIESPSTRERLQAWLARLPAAPDTVASP